MHATAAHNYNAATASLLPPQVTTDRQPVQAAHSIHTDTPLSSLCSCSTQGRKDSAANNCSQTDSTSCTQYTQRADTPLSSL